MITKAELDKLVEKYETIEFIKNDPIQFPHSFNTKNDIEVAGFFASLLAYGNRKIFISKLKEFFSYTQNEPCNFIKNGDFSIIKEKDFNYRFSKSFDIIALLKILSELYNTAQGLEELFKYGYCEGKLYKTVVDYFYSRAPKNAKQGFYHLIPNPECGSPMKRMNMFLRWMVRKSEVDLGIWDFMPTSDLLIPLDVHVARISREMNLLNRKSNDMKSVVELTDNLKQFDCLDPVKYDFAIFGKGVDK